MAKVKPESVGILKLSGKARKRYSLEEFKIAPAQISEVRSQKI